MKEYKHIGLKERKSIYMSLQYGLSINHIAKKLNRSRSTIYRELARNKEKKLYLPDTANKIYLSRYKGRSKAIKVNSNMYHYILEKLKLGWSPEQISGRMRLEEKDYYCCHETIYNYIYKSHKGKEWYKYLSKAKAYRGKRKGRKHGSGKYLGLRSINERPAYIEKRNELGHWELDTIVCRGNKQENIATCVERKSRYLIMVKNETRESTPFYNKMVSVIGKKPFGFKTFTCDRGSEFAHYKIVENSYRSKFYFCDPYSPWQKGTNENTNGRIRKYIPRSFDITKLDQKAVDFIAKKMNSVPRKILGYQTPREVINYSRNDVVALLT